MAKLDDLPNGLGQPWLTAYGVILIAMKGLKSRF
jgi:hypothetical protein